MKKLSVILPALALAVALSGSAMADNGAINSVTLNEMGLAGIELMSDEAAMAIRGQGYQPKMDKKPWSLAFGISYAHLETNNQRNLPPESNTNGGGGGGSLGSGSAGTLDGFLAHGKYMAMGEHLSEAWITKSKSHELWVKGYLAEKKVWTQSLGIAAGGKASASSL